MFDLFFTVKHEITGVGGRFFPGLPNIIGMFVQSPAGDLIIFDAGKDPDAA